MSDEHFEPVYGFPGLLPPGERILWQGSPNWRQLALRAFRVREVTAYFVLLLGINLLSGVSSGAPLEVLGRGVLMTVLLAGAAAAVLGVLAYVSARTTVYSVTTRRVAIRTGIAFTATVNLPFVLIDSVDLVTRGHGRGDLVLTLARQERVSYAMCWPSVRPWCYAKPQPMLRCIDNAHWVGEVLAGAVVEAGERVPFSSPATGESIPQTGAVPA